MPIDSTVMDERIAQFCSCKTLCKSESNIRWFKLDALCESTFKFLFLEMLVMPFASTPASRSAVW